MWVESCLIFKNLCIWGNYGCFIGILENILFKRNLPEIESLENLEDVVASVVVGQSLVELFEVRFIYMFEDKRGRSRNRVFNNILNI